MSSFNCEKCGAEIIDTENGYITGCKHYPIFNKINDYKNELEIMDDPNEEGSNITGAVREKLVSLSLPERVEWLIESQEEGLTICEHMRTTIQNDWLAQHKKFTEKAQQDKEAAEDYIFEQHKDRLRGLG